MEQLLKKYPNDLRYVYRQYPLIGTPDNPFHLNAALATQASETAALQGKFWEMHDAIFIGQSEWSSLSTADFEKWLISKAEEIDLDVDKFSTDLTSQKMVDLAQKAWDDALKMSLQGTPTLLVNGRLWPSNVMMSAYNLTTLIELTLIEERQFTQCPPMTIDPTRQYVATLETEKGDIVIELYADKAPLAVNSFIFLAENGWFDGVTFHRVMPDFVAQAGDPSGTGYGSPGYAFKNEISSDLKFDGPGVVGMANAGADSNGSQFFITYSAQPTLDGGYTVFGHVVEGMDVVTNLTPRNPAENAGLPPGDRIISVTIKER